MRRLGEKSGWEMVDQTPDAQKQDRLVNEASERGNRTAEVRHLYKPKQGEKSEVLQERGRRYYGAARWYA